MFIGVVFGGVVIMGSILGGVLVVIGIEYINLCWSFLVVNVFVFYVIVVFFGVDLFWMLFVVYIFE